MQLVHTRPKQNISAHSAVLKQLDSFFIFDEFKIHLKFILCRYKKQEQVRISGKAFGHSLPLCKASNDTLTKNCVFFRQSVTEIYQSGQKPRHSSKEMSIFLSRCFSKGVFTEKTFVFQMGQHTFAADFMHFGRDVAKDCWD